MRNTIEFLRVNAAWLAAGFLLTLSSSYGQTFFISIFAGEIRSEFGLSHGDWGAMYSMGTLASAMVMVWAGTLTDRYRVRELAQVILPFFAVACLAMAAVPGAWALPLVIFALRFAGQGMTTHIAIVAMGRWFVATRGKALSVASLGVTLGESILPLAFVALLGVFAWRGLWVLAAVMILLALPVLLALLRKERTPGDNPDVMSGTGMAGRQWTRPEVVRHWLFWCMVPLLLGPSSFVTALFFQQVHLAEIKGIAHLSIVALFPVFTAASVIMMVTSGLALDRFGTARLLPLVPLPIAVGFLVLGTTSGVAATAVGMALIGLSAGANSTLPNAFWAEFYGTRHLGSIKAMASAIMVLGSAVGPVLTGFGIDAGLGFETQMVLFGVYFVLVAILVFVALERARKLVST
ncbi:putative MFS family arabinose efflux permease [Aliiruegeria haliotis]|uniref:Putative MFS family arabinose efflux permease n=1 Tax=Aliiruegeria haliotis TaxID=1280846 RepID=A0A2T0RHS4_9RHOB|nr:MFS transporter [Aliiruegeria haliotis]PRY20699.1 putative MFS family arabinose efflux permease [Aliiruegeria haliotis]